WPEPCCHVTLQGSQDFEGTTPSKPYSGISGGNGYTAGQCIEIATLRISAMRGTSPPTIEDGVHPSASFPDSASGISFWVQRRHAYENWSFRAIWRGQYRQ